MFKRVGAAILLIENMEKSVTFYREILGMKIKHESPDWVEFVNKAEEQYLHCILKERNLADRRICW